MTLVKMPCIGSFAMGGFRPLLGSIMLLLACLFSLTVAGTVTIPSPMIGGYRQHQRYEATISLTTDFSDMTETDGALSSPPRSHQSLLSLPKVKVRCGFPIECVTSRATVQEPSVLASDLFWVLEDSAWLTLYSNASGSIAPFTPPFTRGGQETFTFTIGFAFPDLGDQPLQTAVSVGFFSSSQFVDESISSTISTGSDPEVSALSVTGPAIEKVLVTTGGELHVVFFSPILFQNASVSEYNADSAARFALRLPTSLIVSPSATPEIRMILTNSNGMQTEAQIELTWSINDLKTGFMVDGEMRWSAWLAQNSVDQVWCDPCTLIVSNLQVSSSSMELYGAPDAGQLRIINTDMRYSRSLQIQPPLLAMIPTFSTVMKPSGSSRIPMGLQAPPQSAEAWWSVASPITNVAGFFIHIPKNLLYMVDSSTGTESKLELTSKRTTISMNVAGDSSLMYVVASDDSSFVISEHLKFVALSFIIGPIPLAPSMIKIEAVNSRFLPLATFTAHVVSEVGTLKVVCASEQFEPRAASIALSCHIDTLAQRMRNQRGSIHMSIDLGSSIGTFPEGVSFDAGAGVSLGDDVTVGSIGKIGGARREFGSVQNLAHFSLKFNNGCGSSCSVGQLSFKINVDYDEFGLFDLQSLYLRFSLVTPFGEGVGDDPISAPYASGLASIPFESETEIMVGDSSSTFEVALGEDGHVTPTFPVFVPPFVAGEGVLFEVAMDNFPEDVQPTLVLSPSSPCTKTVTGSTNVWLITCELSATLGTTIGAVTFTFNTPQSLELLASRFAASFSTRVYRVFEGFTYAAIATGELRPAAVSKIRTLIFAPRQRQFPGMRSARGNIIMPDDFTLQSLSWAASDTITIHFHNDAAVVGSFSSVEVGSSANCNVSPSWDSVARTMTLTFSEPCTVTAPLSLKLNSAYWVRSASDDAYVYVTTRQMVGNPPTRTVVEKYTLNFVEEYGVDTTFKDLQGPAINAYRRSSVLFPVTFESDHSTAVVSPDDSLYVEMPELTALFPRPVSIIQNSIRISPSVFGVARTSESRRLHSFRSDSMLFGDHVVELPSFTTQNGATSFPNGVAITALPSRVPFGQTSQTHESRMYSLSIASNPFRDNANATGVQTGTHGNLFVVDFVFDVVSPASLFSGCELRLTLATQGDDCGAAIVTFSTANAQQTKAMESGCTCSVTLPNGPAGYILSGDLVRVVVRGLRITGAERQPATLAANVGQTNIWAFSIIQDVDTTPDTSENNDKIEPLDVRISVPSGSNSLVDYDMSVKLVVPFSCSAFAISSSSPDIVLTCDSEVSVSNPGCAEKQCVNGVFECTLGQASISQIEVVVQGLKVSFNVDVNAGPDVIRTKSFDQDTPYFLRTVFERQAGTIEALGSFGGYPHSSRGTTEANWSENEVRTLDVTFQVSSLKLASVDDGDKFWTIRGPSDFLSDPLGMSSPFTSGASSSVADDSLAFETNLVRISAPPSTDNVAEVTISFPASAPAIFGCVSFELDAGSFGKQARISEDLSLLSPMHFFVGPSVNSFLAPHMADSFQFAPFTNAPVTQIGSSLDGTRLFFASHLSVKVFNVLDPFKLSSQHGKPSPNPICTFESTASILAAYLSRNGRWLLTVTSDKPSVIKVTKVHSNGSVKNEFDVSHSSNGNSLDSVTYMSHFSTATSGSDTVLVCGSGRCLAVAISEDRGFLSPLYSLPLMTLSGPQLIVSSVRATEPLWRALTSGGDLVRIGSAPTPEISVTRPVMASPMPSIREVEYKGLTSLVEIDAVGEDMFYAAADNIGFVMLIQSSSNSDKIHSMVQVPCSMNSQCAIEALSVHSIISGAKKTFYIAAFLSDGNVQFISADLSLDNLTLTLSKKPITMKTSLNRPSRSVVHMHPAGSVVYYGTTTGTGGFLAVPLGKQDPAFEASIESVPWGVPTPGASSELVIPLGSVISMTTTISLPYSIGAADLFEVHLPTGSNCVAGSFIHFEYGDGIETDPIQCDEHATTTTPFVLSQSVITFASPVVLPESFKIVISGLQVAQVIPPLSAIVNDGILKFQTFAISVVTADGRPMFHTGDISIGKIIPGAAAAPQIMLSRESDASEVATKYTARVTFGVELAPGSHTFTLYFPGEYSLVGAEVAFTPQAAFHPAPTISVAGQSLVVTLTVVSATSDTLEMIFNMKNPEFTSSELFFGSLATADGSVHRLRASYLPPVIRQSGAFVADGNPPILTETDLQSWIEGTVMAATFSADGRKCAVIGSNGSGAFLAKLGNQFELRGIFRVGHDRKLTHVTGSPNLHSFFAVDDRGLVYGFPVLPQIDGIGETDAFQAGSVMYENENGPHNAIDNVFSHLSHSDSTPDDLSVLELVAVVNWKAPIHFDTDGVAGLLAVTSHGLVQVLPPLDVTGEGGSAPVRVVSFPDDEAITSCNIAVDGETGHVRCVTDMGKLWVSSFSTSESFKLKPPSEWKSVPLTDSSIPAVAIAPPVRSEDDPSGSEVVWVAMADGRVVCVTVVGDTLSISAMSRSTRYTPASIAATADGKTVYMSTVTSEIIPFTIVESTVAPSEVLHFVPDNHTFHRVLSMTLTLSDRGVMVAYHNEIYSLQLLKPMGEVEVRFTRPEGYVPSPSDDLDKARVATVSVSFNWQNLPMSPLRYLTPGSSFALDLRQDFSALTMFGSALEFAKERPSSDISYYSLLGGASVTGLIAFGDSFSESVECSINLSSLVCSTGSLSQISSLSETFAETSATLSIPNVIPPAFTALESLAMSVITQHGAISAMSASIDTRMFRAYGVFHLNTILPANGALLNVGSLGEHSEIVFNPPLEYRDGGFEPYSVLISSTGNGCDLAEAYTSEEMPAAGYGPCCSFSQDGAENTYKKQIERKITSPAFTSRLEVYVICSVGRDGANVRVAPNSIVRTEQMRYDPLVKTVHGTAALSVVILDEDDATVAGLSMKTGAFYKTSVELDVSASKTGPCKDDMDVRIRAPSDYCFLCTDKTAASCAKEGIVTIPKMKGKSETVLYARCVQAGSDIGSFSLAYKPEDAIPYSGNGMPILSVTGSLNVEIGDMPMPLEKPVTMRVTLDTPALKDLNVSITHSSHGGCTVYETGSDVIPTGLIILETQQEVSFDLVCTGMIHIEDGFTLTAIENNNDMSPGQSAVLSTYGVAKVQMLSGTSAVDVSSAAANSVLEIAASDVVAFHVAMNPKPQRGSMFIVTVLADAQCSVSYSDSEVISSESVTANTLVNIVGYADAQTTDLFYVRCLNPVAEQESLQLEVKYANGDAYRFASEGTSLSYAFYIRAIGAMRLYKVSSMTDIDDVSSLVTAGGPPHLINAKELLFMRVELLPPTTTEVELKLKWDATFDCKIWTSEETETSAAAEKTITAPVGTKSVFFGTTCSKPIISSYGDGLVSSITITDATETYPSLKISAQVEIAVRLLLSDASEVPTSLAVDAPLHVHVASDHGVTDLFKVVLKVTTRDGQCRISTKISSNYQESITVDVLDAKSGSVYILCQTMSATSTSISITSNDRSKYRIAKWELAGVTSSGTIYLSSLASDRSAALPSIIPLDTPQELFIHLIPQTVDQVTFTFAKTSAAGSDQPLCGFFDNDRQNVEDTLDVIFFSGSSVSAAVYFVCHSVTEGGPSITITPNSLTYNSYTGTTILPRGSYAFYSPTMELLGTILPFQSPYEIHVKLLPAVESASPFMFTVALSSFAAGCTLALKEDDFDGDGSSGSSVMFTSASSSGDDPEHFLTFFVFCREAAVQGPSLIVTPGEKVLFAQGTTPPFTVSGLMRAVAVTPLFGPDRNTMYPTELSINEPSHFTFIIMPPAPNTLTIEAILDNAGHCELSKRDNSTGEESQDASKTKVKLTVESSYDTPSRSFEGKPAFSLVVKCTDLITGSQPRIKLTMEGESSTRYEPYTAGQAFSISGSMQLTLGSTSNAALKGQKLKAAQETPITLTLTPPPSATTRIKLSFIGEDVDQYQCALSASKSISFAPILFVAFDAGTASHSILLRCAFISKPNTISLMAERSDGDHYKSIVVNEIMIIATPSVTSVGGTPATGNGIGNRVSHTVHELRLALPNFPRHPTVFLVQAVPQAQQELTGGCFFQATPFPAIDKEEDFQLLATSTHITIPTGETAASLFMYCKSPILEASRAPKISVTVLMDGTKEPPGPSGDSYEDYLSPYFIVYAKRCGQFSGPPYGRIDYKISPGGFHDPSFYSEVENLHVLGDTVSYNCDTGYHLPSGVSSDTTKRVCTPWGWETKPLHVCEAVKCGIRHSDDFDSLHITSSVNYATRTNGITPPDGDTTFRAQLTVTCVEGYAFGQLQGREVVKTQSVECGANSQWGAITPCARVDCYPIPRLPDGGNTPNHINGTTYGSIVTLECAEGYEISDPTAYAICMASGQWSYEPTKPICEAKQCIRLTAPDNGDVTFSDEFDGNTTREGATATYTCNSGYETVDDTVRTCGALGWSGVPPECKPVVCTDRAGLSKYLETERAVSMDILLPSGAIIPYESFQGNFTFGMKLSVNCEHGYDYNFDTAKKQHLPVCEADRNIKVISGPIPECKPHICGEISRSIPKLKSIAYVGVPSFSYQTTATYVCDDGFRPSPTVAMVKTCGAAGVEWQPNLDVSCVAQTCSRPGEIPNGKPIQYAEGDYGSFRFGAKAFYSCESGFSIRNSITAIRTCSHGGIWSGDAPLCEPNSCGPFHSEALSNSASVTYFANGYGPMEYHATAKVTCLPGFVLKQGSPSSSTCGIDGWSVKADEITCEDINECATVSCQSMYGPGSYCINTMGSYVCAPYISVGSVAVSGHLKSVTVQYPFTGVVNDDTKEIRIVDTAGRDSISFDIFVGFGTTVFTTGPNAGSTILAVRFVQTISPYTMFSCTIQTTTATQSSQYRRITCLTDPAAGLNLPISFQFCSDRGDRNSDFCWWTPINLSGKEDDGNTLPFVYRLNYPPPTTVAATLRSLTFGDRTGRANLVGRANGKESEEIAILGSGFLNSPGAMEVRYGPRGNETAHLCSVNLEKTTHSLMACSTLNGIQGVDLYFRITVSGQSVISHDRFSYPLTLVLSEVRGCSDVPGDRTIDCPTMGGTTLTIIGDGFLDPTAVYIKGIECPITKRENKVILCSLPPGSGSNVTVSVSSGSQYSERAALLSYALPSITSISSEKCLSFNSTYIYDCPRIMDPKNKAWLVLHGTNFGAESASVYIGGTICQELYHFGDLAMAHTQVRCVIPPGTSTNNEVRLVQMYGEASKEDITLSYTQCAAGYFTVGSACELCPLGQFTGTIGQSECKQCPAGTYAPVVGTSVCLTCPAGSFSGIGANMCLPCPKGTYASSGSGLCTPCAVGTYNDKVRSATCLACPSGGLSDPDYAGCHCGAGHIMNVLGSCEPCMPGGDCSAAHTTFYNVKPLPGFYPTALATDKKAPSVERHIIDLHIDVDLDDDYAAQVFLSRWYEAIYNETGISRARAQIVSVVPHLITLADDNTPIVGGGSGPEEDTAIADIKHAIVGDDNGHVAVDNDFALRNDSAPGTRQVPGVRVTVDIFPETLRTDESASAIAQRLWALMSNPGTYMHSMFGASVAARAPVGNFGRSAYVTFEPCLRNSCVGGDRLCADGYEGPLCSVCNSGYGKVSTYKCERCESLGSRIGWMFLSLIIAVAIVGIMVYLSLRDTNKNFHLPRAIRPSSFAAFVKIIICTIQVWAIAAQYDIAWPGVLSGLMSAISAAGNVGVRASSLDCFATESGYGSSMNTLLRPLFLTSTAVFILPFLAVVLPFLVLLPIWYFHRRRYTSIMETVEYTVAWSNQIEARLKDEREKMDAEAAVAAEKSARIMAMRTAAEEVSVGSSHSRRALSSRRDLISSETAHSSGRSTIDMNPAVPSRRMNITLNTTSSRPGSAGTAGGPLPPPPRPPVSEVGVEMQSFHVNDFAEPQTPVGSERSGASQSGASVRTVATGVSLRGASMRPSSRRRRAEKSFRESLLEAERYTNKGVPVRESRVGRSNSALEFSVESSMREDSIAGGISMIGSPSIGTNVSSTSGAVQRSRSADKSKMNVEDQSAADYTQFQRDKRVYRTMVAKLADLRSYYMCVFFCCIVVAMYLLHPNITIAFFRLVGCKTVGSDSSATIRASLAGSGLTLNDVLLPHSSRRFVLADMSLTCGSSEHLLWVFTLGLAIFAFWVVGIPLTFFLFAFKNRVIIAAQPNALPRAHLRLRRNLELTFAFLFLGYESRAFYWFLVDMMSKVLYAAIMIFFPGEMHIQFLLASFIAFLIITAQTAVRPFDSPVLEQLQFAALLCTFACFFLANFFVIDTELSQFGVDIIKWVIFSAVIIFFAIALLTIYLMYVHDRETESIRKSVTTAIRRNIDPIPLLQEWQRNLANTEEQLRLKKEREAKERRDKDIRQKAQKAASAGTDGEHDSGSDTGDDVLAMAPTPTARHGSGVGGFGSPAAVSSSRGLRGIGSIAEGDGEANTVDDDVAVAGLDEEERRMHIKQRTDALDAEISSFFTNPADEKALKDAGEDFDEAEAPEEIVNLSHKETFTGDFVTEDMRRRAEERAWEAAEDAKNPILKTRKEQMRLYRANLAEELGLAGLTDAQVEAILRSTSALPRSARKEDRIEWSLHASGVQDPQGDPEEKRRALKARKVAPAAAAAAAVLAGTGEVNPVRCGYLGRTTVASAEAMVDEEVPIENEEDFFFNADEVDAMVPPHTYAEPQNHGLDDEAVATLADDQAAAHAASSAEVKVAAAASRASLVASQPLLAPRPSPKQSPTAEKTTMSVKKKQDGSTEIRVGTAKRGHVIKLVRRKKGSAAASGVKASASKPPTDMVNSMVEAAAAAVKRANGEAADNASPEASREVSPTSAKAKKPENSTSRSLAASSMSHGPASTIPAGSSNSSDGSSLHSVSQSPTHSREDSK